MIFNRDKIIEKTEQWTKEAEKAGMTLTEYLESINPLNKSEDDILKESDFHCGVEESGGHAYNCNDCPNKCEEYYQWDKEFKSIARNEILKVRELDGIKEQCVGTEDK